MRKLIVFIGLLAITSTFLVHPQKPIKKEVFPMTGEMCEAAALPKEISVCEVPLEVPEKDEDSEIAKKAVDFCLHRENLPKIYYDNALHLLNVERELKIPDAMFGMTLAAACVESGFDANAEGDHRFSKDGKTPMAIGILQEWPFYETAYKVKRRNVESAARGWLTHIQKQVKSVEKNCKTKDVEETWKVAWVTGVRAPKKGGRCREVVSHYSLYKRMKKSWKI